MAEYDNMAGLQVHPVLRRFVEEEVLPGAALQPEAFWPHLATIVGDLAPRHRDMLAVREALQGQIDDYHRSHGGQPHDTAGYEQFLREIGYLVPEPAADAYKVATKNVDAEMAVVAGPQLVARSVMPQPSARRWRRAGARSIRRCSTAKTDPSMP